MASEAELPKPKRPTRSPRNSRNAEAAEADDARAEQRGDVGIVEARRQWNGEIGANRHILRIAAVHRVAGKYGMIAEVLHLVAAEPAIAVHAAHPGDAHARSDGQVRGCAFHHFADDLMAGNNARPDGRQIAFDDVEIGAADATGDDFEQYLSGLRLRPGNVLNREPASGSLRFGIEYGCSHRKSSMKTGIIGLPQVGKTSLFKILTKAKLEERGHSREEHIGVARVPDERLDKLSALYSPKKTTYATVEFVDVAAIGQEALKETAFLTSLRQVDALIHVLRAFEDDSIPHVGPIDPLRDIKNVEFDLMISDLTQVEKRLERVEKDLKKGAPASWSANRRCCCARKKRWKKSSRCASWR
jgi:hypothetical protein